MSLPTRKGYAVVNYTGSAVTAVSVDPVVNKVNSGDATISAGDWVVFVYVGGINVDTSATPTGITNVRSIAHRNFNTRVWAVYAGTWDGGSIAMDVPASNGAQASVWYGSGHDETISNWIAGAPYYRSGTSVTTPIPGVTTVTADSLVLIASVEVSTVDESAITSISNGAEWGFLRQTVTPQIHTTEVAYIEKPTVGATGPSTVTYPNTTPNGAGVMVVIPPADSTPVASAFQVWDGSTAVDCTAAVWDGTTEIPIRSWAEYYGATLYDSFDRYPDGSVPDVAASGQAWLVYNGAGPGGQVTDGLYDVNTGGKAVYLHTAAAGEVTSMRMRFKFDTHGGTLTTKTSSVVLMVWGGGGVQSVSTRTARMHLVFSYNSADFSVQTTPGGSLTSVQTAPLALAMDTMHEAGVTLSGSTAVVTVNGTEIMTFTDARIADAADMRDICYEPFYNNNATDARARISEIWADTA